MSQSSGATPPDTLLTPRVLIPFLIVSLIWGSTWLVIRDQISSVPPSWSVTYRFLVAGTAMMLLAIIQRRNLGISLRGHGFAMLIGLFQFGANFNFVYRAEAYITSGIVAVLFALLIIPNVALSRLFLGAGTRPGFLTGVLIAIVGVGLMLWQEIAITGIAPRSLVLGLALTFGGIMGASIANVMQASSFARQQDIIVMLGWSMLWGTLFNALFAVATVGPPVFEMRTAYLAGVLYLGLFGSVLTFPLYFGIIRRVGAGPAAWSSVIVPVIAMLLSTLFEGYRWSALSASGAALVIAGLVYALKPPAGQAQTVTALSE